MKNLFSAVLNAAVVVSMVVVPLHAMATERERVEIEMLEEQAECMALNIYYEARGSSFADRVAVSDVVLNRVQDTRYPNTICEVVKQGRQDANGNMIRHQCQFSWYCDGKADDPQDEDLWVDAQSIAWTMLQTSRYRGISEGATHYHATYVNPRWASDLQLVGRIGGHIFYRWE